MKAKPLKRPVARLKLGKSNLKTPSKPSVAEAPKESAKISLPPMKPQSEVKGDRLVDKPTNQVVHIVPPPISNRTKNLVDRIVDVKRQVEILNSQRKELEKLLIETAESGLVFGNNGYHARIVRTTKSQFNIPFFIEVMGVKYAQRFMRNVDVTEVYVGKTQQEDQSKLAS